MPLHRLTTMIVGVTDLDATRDWYREFGLDEPQPGRMATRDGGIQLELEQAPYRGLRSFGLGVDDTDDLDRITAGVTAFDTGVTVTRHADRVEFDDPIDHVPYVVSIARRYPADTATPAAPRNRPAEVNRTDRPAEGVLRDEQVRPSNLTHLVRGTVDHEASIRFHQEALGFELSDPLPGLGGFLRCSDWHHNLMLQQGPAPFLHHIAFEVDDVDEVGRAATHMLERDPACHLWGLGRHAIGSNFFWYLRDPSGNYAEYAADIDRVTDQAAYRPKDWSGHEGLYAWGDPPPTEFVIPPDIEDVVAAMLAH